MRRVGFVLSLTVCLAVILSEPASGQRTTRQRLKPILSEAKVELYDTVFTSADSTRLSFKGYEKTLRSSKESFYVTNKSDSTLERLILSINYLDMAGRQLDRRTIEVDIDMGAGETRRVDVASWDAQKVMYYYRSPKPKAEQATPYKVRIQLVAALKNRL